MRPVQLDRVENGGPGSDIDPPSGEEPSSHAHFRGPRPPSPATVLAAVNDKPSGRPQRGAVIDRRCARWPGKSAVGAEECLRRGRTKEWDRERKIRKALAFRAAIRERKNGAAGGRTKECHEPEDNMT